LQALPSTGLSAEKMKGHASAHDFSARNFCSCNLQKTRFALRHFQFRISIPDAPQKIVDDFSTLSTFFS
jgi:hypothetical protein